MDIRVGRDQVSRDVADYARAKARRTARFNRVDRFVSVNEAVEGILHPVTTQSVASSVSFDMSTDVVDEITSRIDRIREAAYGPGFSSGSKAHRDAADRVLRQMFSYGENTGQQNRWSEILGLRRTVRRTAPGDDLRNEAISKIDNILADVQQKAIKPGTFLGQTFVFSWARREPQINTPYVPVRGPSNRQLQLFNIPRRDFLVPGAPDNMPNFTGEDDGFEELAKDPFKREPKTRPGTRKKRVKGPSETFVKRQNAKEAAARAAEKVADGRIDVSTSVGVPSAGQAFHATSTVVKNALEDALDYAKEYASMTPEQRRGAIKATMTRSRQFVDRLTEIGPMGFIQEKSAAFKKAAHPDGKLTTQEFKLFERIATNPDGLSADPIDVRLARAILDRITDEEQLYDVAARINIGHANKARLEDKAETRIRKLQQVISRKLKEMPLDSVESASKVGGRASSIKRMTTEQRRQFERNKIKVGQLLHRDMTVRNQHIRGDGVRLRRFRRQEVRFNLGGMSQVVDIGLKDERRAFDMFGGNYYSINRMRADLDNVDPVTKRVRGGIINVFGMNDDSLDEYERLLRLYGGESDDLIAMRLNRGEMLDFEVMEMSRKTSTGNGITTSTARLMHQLTDQEIHQMRSLSKTAFQRQLSLDIETGFGKSRALAQYTSFFAGSDADEGAVMEPVFNLMKERGKARQARFNTAVLRGDRSGLVDAVLELRSDDDLWITQMSGVEYVAKADRIGSLMEDFEEVGGFEYGQRNTGFNATRRLTDQEFHDAVVDLMREGTRQQDKRFRSVITGLNVDKFDLRVIRDQAAILGEAYLNEQKLIESGDLSNLRTAWRSAIGVIDASEVADEDLIRWSQDYLPVARERAGTFLAYSGRWNGKRWVSVTDKTVNDARKAHGVTWTADPVSDALQSSDVTMLARRFITNMKRSGAARYSSKVESRVKTHFLGDAGKEARTGYISRDRGKARFRSQSILAWGDDDMDVAQRIEHFIAPNIDPREMDQLIDLAKKGTKNDAAAEALDAINRHYRSAGMGSHIDEIAESGEIRTQLKRLRQLWGERRVEEVKSRIIGFPFSQESIFYTRDNIWNKMIGGFQLKSGQYAVEAAAHGASRDTRVATRMVIEESFLEATKNGARAAVDAINEMSAELKSMIGRGVGKIGSIGYMGQDAMDKVKGAGGRAYAFDVLGQWGEKASQWARESIMARSEDVAAIAGNVSARYNKTLVDASTKLAGELSQALGATITAERIAGRAKGALGLAAVATVAAGALVVGTNRRRAREYDDVWEYGDTESQIGLSMRRRINKDATLGSLVTEMSTRRNYSHNMRSDKHDHLFRR